MVFFIGFLILISLSKKATPSQERLVVTLGLCLALANVPSGFITSLLAIAYCSGKADSSVPIAEEAGAPAECKSPNKDGVAVPQIKDMFEYSSQIDKAAEDNSALRSSREGYKDSLRASFQAAGGAAVYTAGCLNAMKNSTGAPTPPAETVARVLSSVTFMDQANEARDLTKEGKYAEAALRVTTGALVATLTSNNPNPQTAALFSASGVAVPLFLEQAKEKFDSAVKHSADAHEQFTKK